MRIPIHLSPVHAPGPRRAGITFGVPFADGALPAGTALRAVTATGKVLPVQTSTLATWQGDQRFTRWLLADLQAHPAEDGEQLWLEPVGPEAVAPAPEMTISHTSANGRLTVDTGVLRLHLRTGEDLWRRGVDDSPFAGCELRTASGWRELWQDPGLLLYMTDQQGRQYTSLGGHPRPRVVIEEAGPLRTCVLITGHLSSADGLRFCPYRLRVHLFAGSRELRLAHTFIFDQDPTRITLSSVGIKVFPRLGAAPQAALGTSAAPLVAQGEWRALTLWQSDDQTCQVSHDAQHRTETGQAPGWAALSGAQGGVVAALPDFWQEYPKGLQVTPDALDLQIWPPSAPPLSFMTPFREPPIQFNGTRDEAEIQRLLAARPTAPLMLKSFYIKNLDDLRWVEEVMERLAPGRVKSYCDFMGVSTGMGAAKTTELSLHLSAEPISATAAAAFGAAVNEPLLGLVDPSYFCETGVFGPFLPAGDPRFAELDRHLTEIFERVIIEPTERCRRYGMWDYGQMVNGHTMLGGPPTSDLVYHLYKDTAPEKALRYVGPFNNEAMDLALAVWAQFIRTGDRRYLRQAQRTARAIADVSFVHAYPGQEENVGCIHYHGAHAWSNALNRSHSEVGFMVMDYYLTGNRRLREVALEAADGLLYDKLEPCGIINCFSRLHREFTGPLAILMEAYQLTWHEKYGEPARRSLAWLLRTVQTPGHLPVSDYTRGHLGAEAAVEEDCPPGGGATNFYHVLAPALRLFPSATLRDFVIAQAEYTCRYGGAVGLAYAYAIAPSPAYAAAAQAILARIKTRITPETILCFYMQEWCDEYPRLMWLVAQATKADPTGFADFASQWLAAQAAQPPPPKPGRQWAGERHLGRLSTAPLP